MSLFTFLVQRFETSVADTIGVSRARVASDAALTNLRFSLVLGLKGATISSSEDHLWAARERTLELATEIMSGFEAEAFDVADLSISLNSFKVDPDLAQELSAEVGRAYFGAAIATMCVEAFTVAWFRIEPGTERSERLDAIGGSASRVLDTLKEDEGA